MSDPWTRDVEPGSVCDGCGRRVPKPEEKRESRTRYQWNITFDTPEARDQAKEMVADLRTKWGYDGRVQAGGIVHLALYGQLTRQIMEPGE